MKTKTLAILISLSLCLSLVAVVAPPIASPIEAQSPQVLFSDSFESYSVGSFPSAGGWNLWFDGQGSQYQTIVSGTSISGTKVLKLWGADGWAAVAARSFTVSGKIGFEARVKVENWGTSGKNGATVGFAKQVSSTIWWDWATVSFNSNGYIESGGESLQPYALNRWVYIKVLYDPATNTHTVWIDRAVKGKALPNQHPPEIAAFALASDQAGQVCYFDDVEVLSFTDESQFTWRDDFQYSNISQLQGAGWNWEPIKTYLISTDGASAQITNDGSEMGLMWYDNFAPSSPNWRVEARMQWVGGTFGSFALELCTDKHNYGFLLDGQLVEFAFCRDETKVLRFPGYQPSEGTWVDVAYETAANTIWLYFNGALVNTYSEPDPGYPASVGLTAGYLSTIKVDWVSLSVGPVNAVPYQPSNISPADGTTSVSLTPTLQSSAFSDPDVGDTHAASQWQIRTSSGNYSSPLFDTGVDDSDLTSITVPSGILSYSTTYYWHVRYQDNHDAWSSWSVETSFITAALPPTVIFQDDFSGPLMWYKIIGEYGPGSPPPPATTGDVYIEDGELHVSADYWWYNVYAVRGFSEVSGDFEASARFRIMSTSSDATNVGIGLRHGDFDRESEHVGRVVGLGYDGYYEQWVLMVNDQQVGTVPQIVPKDTWMDVTIKRIGNSYQWFVNGLPIYSYSTPEILSVTHMELVTGIGIHWQDGTHVHFDDAVLSVPSAAEVATATGTGTATFTADSGTIENLSAVDPATLPAPPVNNLVFPDGMFSFDITGIPVGGTVTVNIQLPSGIPANAGYWKYDPINGWNQIGYTAVNAHEIAITLADDGTNGDLVAVDGVINDPGGLGGFGPSGGGGAGVPMFPSIWVGISAALGAGIVAYFVRRRVSSKDSV
jgi:hypothetical protein